MILLILFDVVIMIEFIEEIFLCYNNNVIGE